MNKQALKEKIIRKCEALNVVLNSQNNQLANYFVNKIDQIDQS